MTTYQQQKQKVLQLFPSALSLLPQVSKNADLQKRLKEAETHLAEGKLFVVVCGEFKQGKSSLLNALLNEPDLFPVDVDITTNLVSSITYGKHEKITVVVGEPGKQQTKEIQRNEIPDYVTEQKNQGNARKAQLLIIESPNPQLREGLVLVDTPGVGSLSAEHTAATYAFIPNADAILFVSDAFAPLSAKELEFIQNRIAPHCQNLIFVVTKVDKVSDYKAVVANNREKLAAVLGRSSSEIPIISVSSKLKLNYLISQNAEDLEDSKFPSLENELWQMISQQRGQILLVRALSELGRAIAEIKQPIQVEWEACQQHSPEELDAWESQFQETKLRLQSLLEHNADWLSQLSYGMQDIQDQTVGQFRKGCGQIRTQADKYLDDIRLLENPKEIASLLEAEFDALMSKLNKQLSEQAAGLHSKIEDESGLNLNPFEVGTLVARTAELTAETVQICKSGWWKKSTEVARHGLYGGTPGTIVGGILGGAAGAAVGFLFGGVGAIPGLELGAQLGASLGALAGAVTGAKQGLEQVQERDKTVLKSKVVKIINKFIEDSQQLCQETLLESVKLLGRSIKEELTQQIKREKENSDRTLRSLQDARKLTQEQGLQKAKELQVQLGKLNQLQANVEQLAKTIVASSVTDSPPEPSTPAPQAMATAQPKQVVGGGDSGDWADE